MEVYLFEFLGVALLILLGNGIVANIALKSTFVENMGRVGTTIGCGLAPGYIVVRFFSVMTCTSRVWPTYGQYDVTEDQGAFPGSFANTLANKSTFLNFSTEFIATFTFISAIFVGRVAAALAYLSIRNIIV